MSVTVQWDDKGLKRIFDSLGDSQQAKFHASAMRSTARKLAKMVTATAASAGFSRTGAAEMNGWRWVRYGRVPASVASGKLWKKGTKQTIRVYNKGGKRVSFSKSAPHAHLVILGHRKILPLSDGSTYGAGRASGVPIYQAAFSQADVLFERELEASVKRMIRKLNKEGKL